MSRSYFTEDAKMCRLRNPQWNFDDCYKIETILSKKGYYVSCVQRVGCDGKYHDAWQVERKDIPRLIEQCFRQRLTVEVQAEGKGKASINFVYNYAAETIIEAVGRFQKNKGDDL